MSSNRPLPVLLPLAMLGFALLQLAFEHFTGGVASGSATEICIMAA